MLTGGVKLWQDLAAQVVMANPEGEAPLVEHWRAGHLFFPKIRDRHPNELSRDLPQAVCLG